MAIIVIDLMGDDDTVVSVPPEEDPDVKARLEEQRIKVLEEILRRAPQPALQIVPTDQGH
jgi:hypothetical protein